MPSWLRRALLLVLPLAALSNATALDSDLDATGMSELLRHFAQAGALAGQHEAVKKDANFRYMCGKDPTLNAAMGGLIPAVIHEVISEEMEIFTTRKELDCNAACWQSRFQDIVVVTMLRSMHETDFVRHMATHNGNAKSWNPDLTSRMHLLSWISKSRHDYFNDDKLEAAMEDLLDRTIGLLVTFWEGEEHEPEEQPLDQPLSEQTSSLLSLFGNTTTLTFLNFTRAVEIASSIFNNDSTLNSTIDSNSTVEVDFPQIRVSQFLDSVMQHRRCEGSSYLCPIEMDDREPIENVHRFLIASTTPGVVDRGHPFQLLAESLKGPVLESETLGWHIPAPGTGNHYDLHKHSYQQRAEKMVKDRIEKASIDKEAAKMVLPEIRYRAESFDEYFSGIFENTLRPFTNCSMSDALQAAGYMCFLRLGESGEPMEDDPIVRLSSGVIPIAQGLWKYIEDSREPSRDHSSDPVVKRWTGETSWHGGSNHTAILRSLREQIVLNHHQTFPPLGATYQMYSDATESLHDHASAVIRSKHQRSDSAIEPRDGNQWYKQLWHDIKHAFKQIRDGFNQGRAEKKAMQQRRLKMTESQMRRRWEELFHQRPEVHWKPRSFRNPVTPPTSPRAVPQVSLRINGEIPELNSMGRPILRTVNPEMGTALGEGVMGITDAHPVRPRRQAISGRNMARMGLKGPDGIPALDGASEEPGLFEFERGAHPGSAKVGISQDLVEGTRSSRRSLWPRTPFRNSKAVNYFPKLTAAQRAAATAALAEGEAAAGRVVKAAAANAAKVARMLVAPAALQVLGIAGGVVSGGLTIYGIQDEVRGFARNFGPDKACPHEKFRTVVWTPEMATMTDLVPPCTPTPKHPKRQEHEANDSISWLAANTLYNGVYLSEGNHHTDPVMPLPTAVANEKILGPESDDLFANMTCPERQLPDGWTYQPVLYYPCPMPVPYACTDDWFHQNVNWLPTEIRNPNFCDSFRVDGVARANHEGCGTEFKSKKCRRIFGLDKNERDRLHKIEDGARKWAEQEEESSKDYEKHYPSTSSIIWPSYSTLMAPYNWATRPDHGRVTVYVSPDSQGTSSIPRSTSTEKQASDAAVTSPLKTGSESVQTREEILRSASVSPVRRATRF